MELSVILSVRNGARTISRQLDALARQRWEGDWEVVVSDNGSTDDSRAIAERYRDRLPNLRIVDASARIGLAHSRNAGAAAAAGQALAFCDDDDEVADGWVAAMGDALRRNELVAGRLEHDRLNEPWAIAIRGRPQSTGLVAWGSSPYLPFGFGCTLGVRRSLHEAIGGFDERLVPSAEDMDYCWRLQLAGTELRFVPGAVTHYQLRHSLRELYRQGRNYGIGNVLVYMKYRRPGMPRASHRLGNGLRKWLTLPKQFALATSRERLGIAVWHLGLRTGMLRASIENRVLFP